MSIYTHKIIKQLGFHLINYISVLSTVYMNTMLKVLETSKEEKDIISQYDPFPEYRDTVKIRRGGTWYDISVIDMNEKPIYPWTIICVHGWGSNALNFRFLLKHLSPFYRVISYDLKGHGESCKDEDSYDLTLFTEELAQIVDHYNPDNLVLVGHSMGTAIVLNYLYLNPNRAKASVILSGSANFAEPVPRLIPLILTYMDEKVKNLFIEIATSFLSTNKYPELRKLVREQLKRTPYFVFRRSLINTVFAWKRDEDLNNIKIPILIMTGEKDILTTVKQSKKLNKLIPNSRLVILPGSRHDIPIEKGREVSDLIYEFVEFQIDRDRVKIPMPNF